jgi:general secretion pathway protein I
MIGYSLWNHPPGRAVRPRESGAGVPPPATSSGFTLLEVMVALAIMAIVLVSVYRLHSQTLSMSTASRFQTQAPLLAQAKLAEIDAGETFELGSEAGGFGEDFPGYAWQVDVTTVASEALGEVAEDLKQIDLTVSFDTDEQVYRLRTYRFLPK